MLLNYFKLSLTSNLNISFGLHSLREILFHLFFVPMNRSSLYTCTKSLCIALPLLILYIHLLYLHLKCIQPTHCCDKLYLPLYHQLTSTRSPITMILTNFQTSLVSSINLDILPSVSKFWPFLK